MNSFKNNDLDEILKFLNVFFVLFFISLIASIGLL